MGKNGEEYEFFVQKIMQVILSSENEGGQKNIIVEQNKKIVDRCGIERQFDIYWEYNLGGFTYKTVIECKDYFSSISIDKIDSLIGKIQDIPNLRGIFATTTGYQSGAKKKAEKNNIELLIIREQNDNDWVLKDGTPLIKKVLLNLTAILPPEIIQCDTLIDKTYVEENKIDASLIDFSKSLNIDVLIEDKTRNEKYSLFDLKDKLPNKDGDYGEQVAEFDFEDAFISDKKIRVKLKRLKVKYRLLRPITLNSEIDISKEFLGVVEYLNQNKKKMIGKKGQINEI